MDDVIRRLNNAIEKAKNVKNYELYRLLVLIRDGSVYGSKQDPKNALKDFYLAKKD